MAVSLLSHEVADLCIGKPALRSLPLTTSISKALADLKSSGESFLCVWSCDHSATAPAANPDQKHPQDQPRSCGSNCRCVGKICMADVVCYLAEEESLSSPCEALLAPVSEILSRSNPGLVMHVEPSSSLLEAIDLIIQGAQNLVVPIRATSGSSSSSRKTKQHPKSPTLSATSHNGQEFCWITQEDIVRYLLSSIGLFSPLPTLSIDTLGLITTSILTIDYHSPASSALPVISRSLATQTSVAVVESDGEDEETRVLVGEISPITLSCCDETVAIAIATLSSAGDLMAYIDCGGPPEDLVKVVIARLQEAGNEAALREFVGASYSTNSGLCSSLSSSSDEEYSGSSPVSTLRGSGGGNRGGKHGRSMSYSARMGRRSEAIVCHPKSSLIAVMIQAISHRVNYVWVVEEDCSLVGIVTFSNMLRVFRDHLVLGMAY